MVGAAVVVSGAGGAAWVVAIVVVVVTAVVVDSLTVAFLLLTWGPMTAVFRKSQPKVCYPATLTGARRAAHRSVATIDRSPAIQHANGYSFGPGPLLSGGGNGAVHVWFQSGWGCRGRTALMWNTLHDQQREW